MNGQPESEQLQNFHERLSEWVSNQGFWFQLRYSMSGGGVKGAVTFHLLKLLARLAIFLLVLGISVWIFLVKQSGSEGFVGKLKDSYIENFSANEIELNGFSRQKGEFYISRMAMTGGGDTFFSAMELRNLRCTMGLLDPFKKEWDPGLVEISRATVSLRAGADSVADANGIADVLFQDTGRLKLNAIEVDDISLDWGYSERTRGSISGSRMRAQRLDDSWRLKFTGGTFSQNWLKRLEIVELEVVFGRQGIVFEKAVFKKGEGYVTFSGTKVKAGERPEISGTMNLRKMDVAAIVPVAVRNFVEGTVSGEFKVFGSTNSTEGLGFEGDVVLNGEDMVVLRDRVHLLRALSVVDAFNSYRRLDFRDGSFHMKSLGGNLEVSNVNLKAGELFEMKGDMKVRIPTEDEARMFTGNTINGSDFDAILNDDELGNSPDLSLRGAAEGSSDDSRVGFDKGEDDSLFDRLGLGIEVRRLEERAAEQLSRAYRYEGNFTISLPKEAFVRAPHLAEMFPVDEKTNRISMEVPLGGHVLYDITLNQADEIYKKGTRQ